MKPKLVPGSRAIALPDTKAVRRVFPQAKTVPKYKGKAVFVRHGVPETRLLRRLGAKIPCPMEKHYPWKRAPWEAQQITSSMLVMYRRGYVLNDMGCVDSETEYLSPTGWRRIADYAGGLVAQYLPESRAAEFVVPSEFVKLPCDTMVRIKTSRGIDQLLSPEHRVLLHSYVNPVKQEVVPAIEVYRRFLENKKASRRSEIGIKQACIPTTYSMANEGITLSHAQIRLQVAVHADGHLLKSGKVAVRVKKPRKKLRLRKLLTAADVEYSERSKDYATAKGFTVFTFVPPHATKTYGPLWWGCSHEQRRVVTDEVLHWDGSVSGGRFRFSSFNESDAEFVQHCFASTGNTARLTTHTRSRRGRTETEFNVQARPGKTQLQIYGVNDDGQVKNMWLEPSSDGFKYCFSVPSTFLLFRRNGCVFASGNTGKTYSALAGADFLMQEREVRSALIVAPVSTLVETWRNEILRWFPHRSCAILHASAAARRKELLAMPNDFYIVNHHGVEVLHEELEARPDIDLVILDELSTYRNGRAGRDADGKIRHRLYYYAKQLVKGRKYVWGMTGAVCPNAPTDAWAQAQLITPNRITPWWTEFRDKTMIRIDQHLWVDKDNAMDTVYNTLQPSVRFKLEDCQDLPPVVLETRDVPMSKHQQKAYSDIMLSLNRNIVISNSSGKPEYVDSVNEAVQINKLLQIACGWIYGDKHQNIDLAPAGRLNELLAVINEAPAKVIVFAPFKNAIEEMAKFLQKKKVDCAMIHSEVSRPARDKIFSAFQHTPKYRVIVAQPGTMSHGLTLTAASIIVWYAPIHSLDTYIQANRRITRPGQQHGQVIIHLKGSPVEARIYSKLQKQERKLNILLDLFESNPTTGEHYGRSGIPAAA